MSKKNGYFYFTCSLLTGEVLTFSKTPPSPLNLKRGSTFPPKSSPPQEWRT